MAPASLCAGCQQKLPIRETLICSLCKCRYDLECAGISKEYYLKSMTFELRKSWKCQQCICKIPKTGNTDTPIRNQKSPDDDQDVSTPTASYNVTMRKKTINSNINDTVSSEDLSILGDTIQIEDTDTTNAGIKNESLMQKTTSNSKQVQFNMQSLSELIILRLKENNKSIIEEIQNTIQIEINRAITELRLDFDSKTNKLTLQNEQRKQEIQNINSKLETLQLESENLKREIRDLLPRASKVEIVPENHTHKLVLYGFTEYYQEPECELYNRLLSLFHDIVNVDLSGYIEDIYRVGRKGTKNRPLVIELLSKRVTRYIVSSSQCFQGTGLGISEFLNAQARKERAQIREQLFIARQNGHHAIIRNNQLYIDGKPFNNKYPNNKPQHLDTTEHGNDVTTMNTNDHSCHVDTPKESVNRTFRKQRPTI